MRSSNLVLTLMVLAAQAANPATIVVEGGCTLVDAITAANTDSPVGGCSAGSGADEILLTDNVVLTEVDNNSDGPNGLPSVTSVMTIKGYDFSVRRDDAAPDFRLVHVDESGDLTLENVVVSNGSGFSPGGGLHNQGNLALENSTVSRNSGGSGGGIFSSGSLLLYGSTVSDNYGYDYYGAGGGIMDAGNALVVNSTISGNAICCRKVLGGGIASNFRGSETILVNSTVAANSRGGVAVFGRYREVRLSNTVVAENTCVTFAAGQIIDDGGNFASDDSCGAGFGTITEFDAVLADNGGPTQTHALLPGSSAIDAAGDCGLDTDQRGVARDDGACDSGSFEFIHEPCVLRLRVDSPVWRPGERLEVGLYIQHNRARTVTVPFRVWIEDTGGSVIVRRTTKPITLEEGDILLRQLVLTLPGDLLPGRYEVKARVDKMKQGAAQASLRALVIE